MIEEGGGASRSTDPATGSSAATDVSLREYSARETWWLDRHLTAEIAALRRETTAATDSAKEAIQVAKDEATERLKSHNGLIEKMEDQASHFATSQALDDFKVAITQTLNDYKEAANDRLTRIEKFQYTLAGIGLILIFIGVSNLVKVWTG